MPFFVAVKKKTISFQFFAPKVYKMKRNEYEGLKKEKDAFKKQMEDIDVTFEPMLEKKKEAEKKLIKLKSSLAEKVKKM